ncbi:MAG: bifunctional metallophosphatase/5'-nucleotidase [Bacteroides sp.]|nr:bifunctional metallophosphatase/5'-nucleotidase [Bacteroides sp.]MCM1448378.1 bifunctional metallophosphatase/5'-nucleotidase [Bacteroides sp.]
MKKTFPATFLAVFPSVDAVLRMGLSLALACVLVACGEKRKSIVILYENDVHCNLDGYARLRGLADSMSDTAYVAVTSSGDYLHGGKAGAISEGAYIMDIMKNMDYAAVGLGNHEFDFGVPRLRQLMAESGLPVVSLNLRTLPGDSLLFTPYIVRDYGDIRIAFLGVVTPESLLSEAYSFYDSDGNQLYDLCQTRIIDEVQETVDLVRSRGADYVILLSHLGEASAKGFITSGEVIAATHGIDAVLDGHTHSVVPCDTVLNVLGCPVPVTQTGTKFRNVGKLLIAPDGHLSMELIPVDSIKEESARIREVTDSIQTEMSLITSRPVCHSDYSISILDADKRQRVRYAETNAGDIVSDAFRAVTGAQLAVNNGGGIRSNIPAGDWTEGDIIDMLPYNNYIQVVRITGITLLDLLHATTANSPREDGQFPQISGFRFTLNTRATDEERISGVEIFNDSTGVYVPLDPRAEYTLCTTDYCISGGGMYGVLRNADVLKEHIMLYNEALVTYLRDTLQGIVPPQYAGTQGRIVLR